MELFFTKETNVIKNKGASVCSRVLPYLSGQSIFLSDVSLVSGFLPLKNQGKLQHTTLLYSYLFMYLLGKRIHLSVQQSNLGCFS